jgi:hypothetical protein
MWLARFKSSGAPTGTSFEEMMRNFELQRDREFSSHVCADHPRNTAPNSSDFFQHPQAFAPMTALVV